MARSSAGSGDAVPPLDDALRELAQAPPAAFVAERKRVVARLRDDGARDVAAEVARRRRPTSSVWAVNRLYAKRRAAFDRMVEAAARLRAGDLAATRAYRDELSALRHDAASLLEEAGLGAPDATLRRVAATLAAVAAAGFAPDPEGALAEDRDPPGFEALDATAPATARRTPSPGPARDGDARGRDERAQRATQEREERKRAREREERERGARADELARARAQRAREVVERELRAAKADLERREREATRLTDALRAAEEQVAAARERVSRLERRRDEVDEGA